MRDRLRAGGPRGWPASSGPGIAGAFIDVELERDCPNPCPTAALRANAQQLPALPVVVEPREDPKSCRLAHQGAGELLTPVAA